MYCTYLTVYFGDKLPRRYIGSTTIEKVNSGYNGSVASKKWEAVYRQEQMNNKHLFKTRILSLHESDIEAREMELKLHLKYNVVSSDLYFNESLARPNGHFGRDVSGKNNPMYGKSRTGERHKGGENISAALKKLYAESVRGEELKRISSERFKVNNPASDPELIKKAKETWKKNNRNCGSKNPMYGKIGRLKGKKLYNNGVVVKAFIEGQQPEGWVAGRIVSCL